MLSFSEKEPTKEENLEAVPENFIQNYSPFTLIEDPFNMHKTTSNKTTLVWEMPIIIDKENDSITPRQGKHHATW